MQPGLEEAGMGRVLIIEDDLATLYALGSLFEHDGWEVTQSRTIAGGIAQLQPPPDWIVLDMGLADGDGHDVLRHLRAAAIPSRVAILSGLLDEDRVAGLKSYSPDLMLQKPIQFADLLAACQGDRANYTAGGRRRIKPAEGSGGTA